MADNTFHIKNFDRLQHYKDRSPPWIKLYNGLLDDYAFAHLPDASKAHLLAIGLLASRYSNKIPLDADWISKRINATEDVDLDGLIESGFIIPDQPCSNALAECLQDARPEREGETQVQTEKKDTRSARFEEFWLVCPKKIGKGQAEKAWPKATKLCSPEILISAMRVYAGTLGGKDATFTVHPATWLNSKRWLDDGIADAPEPLTDEQIAINMDRADRLMKRGKYAPQFQ